MSYQICPQSIEEEPGANVTFCGIDTATGGAVTVAYLLQEVVPAWNMTATATLDGEPLLARIAEKQPIITPGAHIAPAAANVTDLAAKYNTLLGILEAQGILLPS